MPDTVFVIVFESALVCLLGDRAKRAPGKWLRSVHHWCWHEALCADTHLAHKPETMSLPELAGDICKWMTYDNLVVNWTSDIACWTNNDMTSLHVLFGSLAAIAGRYVQDITPSNKDGMETDRADKSYVSYSQTALEGGVLFGTYRSTLSFLNSVVPDDWNKKFLFHSCLENIEKMLPEL